MPLLIVVPPIYARMVLLGTGMILTGAVWMTLLTTGGY